MVSSHDVKGSGKSLSGLEWNRRRNMKSIQTISRIAFCCASITAVVLCPSLSQATPYASGVTNAGGTIKFFLNEKATTVQVAFDNGSVTNDLTPLGQTNIGVNSF